MSYANQPFRPCVQSCTDMVRQPFPFRIMDNTLVPSFSSHRRSSFPNAHIFENCIITVLFKISIKPSFNDFLKSKSIKDTLGRVYFCIKSGNDTIFLIFIINGNNLVTVIRIVCGEHIIANRNIVEVFDKSDFQPVHRLPWLYYTIQNPVLSTTSFRSYGCHPVFEWQPRFYTYSTSSLTSTIGNSFSESTKGPSFLWHFSQFLMRFNE